jgi:hypothetical protein
MAWYESSWPVSSGHRETSGVNSPSRARGCSWMATTTIAPSTKPPNRRSATSCSRAGSSTATRASVETEDSGDALARSIAEARHNLIAEHLGVSDAAAHGADGLVVTLNDLAERRAGRLRLHPSPTETERALLEMINPQQLPFDPAAIESHDHDRSIFVGGLGALWTRLSGGASKPPDQ